MKYRRVITMFAAALTLCVAAAAQNRAVVDKRSLKLVVVAPAGDTLMACRVAVGDGLGQKKRVGDHRTPEGTFVVTNLHNASHWTHDFGDGAGQRRNAYGRWFVRLLTPGFSGIGLHGTCFPESIGTRATEGCVRLLDDDLSRLVSLIHVGDSVQILPDPTSTQK
ncbi:MAG: L,D-transpeptidase [Bacteroidales bacterium]|nr:L,D-transpeptidase [Bacteroidales bacterium]